MQTTAIEDRAATLAALHRSINSMSRKRERLIESESTSAEVAKLDDELAKAYEELEKETQTPRALPKRIISGGKMLPPVTGEDTTTAEEQFVREVLDGVKRIIEAEGISQKQLANLLGITQPTVSTAINFDNKSSRWRGLKLTTIARMYDVLGYKVHLQAERKENENKPRWRNV